MENKNIITRDEAIDLAIGEDFEMTEFLDVMLEGFKGYNNFTNDELENDLLKKYKIKYKINE